MGCPPSTAGGVASCGAWGLLGLFFRGCWGPSVEQSLPWTRVERPAAPSSSLLASRDRDGRGSRDPHERPRCLQGSSSMAWPAGLPQEGWARSSSPPWGGSRAGVLNGAAEEGNEEALHSHHLPLPGSRENPQLPLLPGQ